MTTTYNASDLFLPTTSSDMNQQPSTTQYRTMKRKASRKNRYTRKNRIDTHFRLGGNRKDPLNLNALIQKKKEQLAQETNRNDPTQTNNSELDRPIEILFQIDMCDPLQLDTSTSRNNNEDTIVDSLPSNSTNQLLENQNPISTRRKRFTNRKRKKKNNNNSIQLPPPRYGNFQGYYGYRQPNHDQRLQYLEPQWFHDKQVLDIGCHTGHVTFYVAEHFQPKQIVGVDIDQQLVQQARQQLWHRMQTTTTNTPANIDKRYPVNLRFQQANFVLDNDADLINVTAEYDTIIAFSVTKWIHLNFGDQGLKRFFKRIIRALYPGGRLLLEPQPWSSYRLKRRMTKDISETFSHIQLKPTEFVSYLLSAEVGFETCTKVATPENTHKGFQRSIFLFTKPSNGDNNPVVSGE